MVSAALSCVKLRKSFKYVLQDIESTERMSKFVEI